MPLQEDSYLQIYWKPLPGKTTKPSSLANLLLPKEKWRGAATNFNYTYSNTTKQALIWTLELLKLTLLEEKRAETYSSLLCSIYTITATRVCLGTVMVKRFKEKRSIASVSFGAERNCLQTQRQQGCIKNFSPRKLTANERRDPDSLACTAYLLLLSVTTPRVNLTFRTIELK
jgi:hypothetical protein